MSWTRRWRFSASSYHCRSPRSHDSISRLPSMVGGIASSVSMMERIASADSHGLNSASFASSSSRNSMPASPPRFCLATSGVIGVQPISAACFTIGNWTVPASLIFSSGTTDLQVAGGFGAEVHMYPS